MRRCLPPLILLPVVSAIAVGGCGSQSVDAADIEAKITDNLAKQVGTKPKRVVCPEDGLQATVGATLLCELTAPNGDRLDVAVTADRVDGKAVNYSFKVGTKVK